MRRALLKEASMSAKTFTLTSLQTEIRLDGGTGDNIVSNLCAKFNDDRLWNEKALVHWKSDNNNHKNSVAIGNPFPGPKMLAWAESVTCGCSANHSPIVAYDVVGRKQNVGSSRQCLATAAKYGLGGCCQAAAGCASDFPTSMVSERLFSKAGDGITKSAVD